MFRQYLKIVASFAVLLHLADGLLASLAHSHGPVEAAVVVEHSGHHHHGACGHHSHDGGAEEHRHGPALPSHDDHDCAACRHLAQAATHTLILIEPPTLDRVAPLCVSPVPAEVCLFAHDYDSRGPPAVTL